MQLFRTGLVFTALATLGMLNLAADAQQLQEVREAGGRSSAKSEADKPLAITVEQAANPPERKINFERLSEPLFKESHGMSAALREKQYVAIVRLMVPSASTEPTRFIRKEADVYPLQFIGPYYLLNLNWGAPSEHRRTTISESLVKMLEAVPEDRRPDEESLYFLDKPAVLTNVTVSTELERTPYRELRVHGNTAEQAEQAATALLTILDQGMSRPIQLHLLEQRAEQVKIAADAQQKTDEFNVKIATLQKEAEELDDFPGELLAGLRVQQLQLEVDVAGLKSRIEACERLLAARDELPNDRRAEVLDQKIAAEIDLASSEARRKTLESFVAKVKRSMEIQKELKTLIAKRQSSYNSLHNARNAVDRLDVDIREFQPRPLQNDTVLIQPVKWAEPTRP